MIDFCCNDAAACRMMPVAPEKRLVDRTAPELADFVCPDYLPAAPLCRECRGYNTREGKKRARSTRVSGSRPSTALLDMMTEQRPSVGSVSMFENRDPFAHAGIPQNQDAEILALFHQWLDVCDERDRLADDDEVAIKDNDRRMIETERAIAASRGGPVGLAIKTFLDCRSEAVCWVPKTSQIRFFDDDKNAADVDLIASLLRDAAMIVPEIGELAAAVIHDDAALIDAEIELQWIGEVWPEGDHTDDWRRETLAKGREALAGIANTSAKTPRGEAIKSRFKGASLVSQPNGEIGFYKRVPA